MPGIPADPVPVAFTGPGSALVISGRGILFGYSFRNLLAVATQIVIWDGPIDGGVPMAVDTLPASTQTVPFSFSTGIQFVNDLRIELEAAAQVQGSLWVLPETKITDWLVSAQSRGGGVQAYLTNMLAPVGMPDWSSD